jgi:hypothetical protein
VERALFKRGRVRIVGEHATASNSQEQPAGSRARLAFSNPRGPLAVTSTSGTGPLNFRCFMPSFLWLSPPATDPISKLAKPLAAATATCPLINRRLTPKRAPPLFALLSTYCHLLLRSPSPLPLPSHCLTTSRCLRRQLFPTSTDSKSISHTS